LIGIMRAQKQTNWGVGELLNEHDLRLQQLG